MNREQYWCLHEQDFGEHVVGTTTPAQVGLPGLHGLCPALITVLTDSHVSCSTSLLPNLWGKHLARSNPGSTRGGDLSPLLESAQRKEILKETSLLNTSGGMALLRVPQKEWQEEEGWSAPWRTPLLAQHSF